MAKGKCINFDKPCDLAMSGKIQEADESNFVCEECGKPLDPVKSEGGNKGGCKSPGGGDPPKWKLAAMAAGAVAVLGGLGFGASKFFGSDKTEPPTPPEPIVSVRVTPTEATDTVGKIVALTAVTSPDGSAVVWTSSDEKTATVDGNGQVKLIKAGEVDITCMLNDSVKAVSHIKSVDKPKTGGGDRTIDVGFGRYTGPTANGQPDGYGGTVNVTRPTYLDLLDGEKLTISPGDKIVNCKFRRGKLIQGFLKRSNGEGRDFMTGIVE